MKEKSVSEFISTVIYFHHGMGDCINLDNGQSLQQQRDEKQIDYDWIKRGWKNTVKKQFKHIRKWKEKSIFFIKSQKYQKENVGTDISLWECI